MDNELSKCFYKYTTFISPFIKVYLVIVIHFSLFINQKEGYCMNWLAIAVLLWLIIFWSIVGFGWYLFGFLQMTVYILAYMFITFGILLLSFRGANNEN